MEQLNLNVHGPEEISGKGIVINGVRYEALEMIDEGGEAFVFPLRNCRSGLSLFIIKVFKWRPGSSEYADVHMLCTEDAFARSCEFVDIEHFTPMCQVPEHGISHPFTPVPETYAIHGGLLQLQARLDQVDDPQLYPDRLTDGLAAVSEGRYEEARRLFDEILHLNPFHTEAMFYAADCLIALGDADGAAALVEDAISIEPNDAQLYHRLAKALLILKTPTDAIEAIERTLRRWPWDVSSWYIQAALALDFGLTTHARQRIDESLRLAPDSRLFQGLKEEWSDSQDRKPEREELSRAARDIQRMLVSADKVDAFELWCDCTRITRSDWRVRFNRVRFKTWKMYGESLPFDAYHDRPPPAAQLGAYPDVVAYEHATALALLSTAQEVTERRTQDWCDLLQAVYSLYEQACDCPVLPPVIVGEGDEQRICCVKAETHEYLRLPCSKSPPRDLRPTQRARRSQRERQKTHRTSLLVLCIMVLGLAAGLISGMMSERKENDDPKRRQTQFAPMASVYRPFPSRDAEVALMSLAQIPSVQQESICRGRTLIESRKYNEAVVELIKAAKMKPQFAASVFYAGCAFQLNGQNERAIESLSSFMQVLENDEHFDIYRYGALYYRGRAYLEMGQYSAAVNEFSELIRDNPEDAEAYRQRHLAHDKWGQDARAMADLEMAQLLER